MQSSVRADQAQQLPSLLTPSALPCQVAGLYSTYKRNNGTNYTGGCLCGRPQPAERWNGAGRACTAWHTCASLCSDDLHPCFFLCDPPPADTAPAVASAAGPAADPAMVAASSADPSSGGGGGGLTGGEIAGIVLVSVGAALAVATGLVMAAVAYRKRSQG